MSCSHDFDTKSETKSSISSFKIDADGNGALSSERGLRSFVVSEGKGELSRRGDKIALFIVEETQDAQPA